MSIYFLFNFFVYLLFLFILYYKIQTYDESTCIAATLNRHRQTLKQIAIIDMDRQNCENYKSTCRMEGKTIISDG